MVIPVTAFLFSAIVSCAINVTLVYTRQSSWINLRKYVLGYLICLLIIYGEHFIEFSGYSCDLPFTIYMSGAFYFLLAPFMHAIVKSFFGEAIVFKKILLELLPAAVVFASLLTFYLLPGQSKCDYLVNYSSSYFVDPSRMILSGLFLLQTVVYSLVWYKKIWEYNIEVKGRASSGELEFIPWVSRWLSLITLFTFSIIIGGLMRVISPSGFYIADQAENIVLSLIPHAFLMLMFFLPESPFPTMESTPKKNGGIKTRVEPGGIQLLKQLMEEGKLYLNPDLTSNQVGEAMGISRHALSKMLNHGLNTNFYDFVNAYRIDHAKALMDSEMVKTFSLSGIARESGFNNYVSFYRVFKRFTKTKPSDYIEKKKK